MKTEACYQLGYVVKAHGTKGQVVAFFDVDYPEEYEEMESVFLEIQGKLVPFFIDWLEPQHKGRFIIQFEDVTTVEEAEKLRGTKLFMPLDTLPELESDQFYFHEVIGYTVVDETHGELGPVKEFYDLPHQALMALDYQGQEILMPVHDDFILRTDREEKKLYVKLPEGLLDVYTKPSAPDERDDEEGDQDAD